MSKTLPRWFGRKSKKKDDNTDKGKQNEKNSKILTSNANTSTNNFHTIRPNYEHSTKQHNTKPFSTFESNKNHENDIINQNREDIIIKESYFQTKNIKQLHDIQDISLKYEMHKSPPNTQKIDQEYPDDIYGGRYGNYLILFNGTLPLLIFPLFDP